MKRSQKITVRVTPEELETIRKGAARRWPDLVERLPLSQVMRSLMLLAAKGYNRSRASLEPPARGR